MDPNLVQHFETFGSTSNQVRNHQRGRGPGREYSNLSQAVNTTFGLTNSPPTQLPSVWDAPASALGPESARSGPPVTPPVNFSFEPVPQPMPYLGLANVMPRSSAAFRPTISGTRSRPSLPSGLHSSGDGPHRKRPRLSADSTPLDTFDYWIRFDDQVSMSGNPENGSKPGRGGSVESGQTRLEGHHIPHRPPLFHTTSAGGVAQSSRGPVPMRIEDYMDDSAMEARLKYGEEGFEPLDLTGEISKSSSVPPTHVPPREGFYSTTLSWEKARTGPQMDPLTGFNNNTFNATEQKRLIEITTNPGPSLGGFGSNLNFDFTEMCPSSEGLLDQNSGLAEQAGGDMFDLYTDTSLPMLRTTPHQPVKQSMAGEKGKEKARTGDRAAHNDIERKYRTKLKDKITELRDAVPTLRSNPEDGPVEEGSHTNRASKISKGTVMVKATEYIHHLEQKNKQVSQQHRELARKLQAYEQLLSATAQASYQVPVHSRTLFDPRGFC